MVSSTLFKSSAYLFDYIGNTDSLFIQLIEHKKDAEPLPKYSTDQSIGSEEF